MTYNDLNTDEFVVYIRRNYHSWELYEFFETFEEASQEVDLLSRTSNVPLKIVNERNIK